MDRRTFLMAALLSGCGGGGVSVAPEPEPEKLIPSKQVLLPDHPALAYTDCSSVEVTTERARFTRPISNPLGYQWVSPGARVRFWTDSEAVSIRLWQTNLMPRDDRRNGVGALLIDGVSTPLSAPGLSVSHAGRRMRLHEIVWPYNASLDFLGVEIDAGATVSAAPRTGRRIVTLGDSITHGFWSSGVAQTWPFLLSKATGLEVINLGVGGRMCVASDGTAAASCLPDVLVYLIGFNEFSQQKDPDEFGARYRQFLQNVWTARPGTQVLCVTPTWSPVDHPIPLEAYRQAIRDNSAGATLVEGLGLTAHDLTAFPDTVHPGDAGAASMAAGLAAFI